MERITCFADGFQKMEEDLYARQLQDGNFQFIGIKADMSGAECIATAVVETDQYALGLDQFKQMRCHDTLYLAQNELPPSPVHINMDYVVDYWNTKQPDLTLQEFKRFHETLELPYTEHIHNEIAEDLFITR